MSKYEILSTRFGAVGDVVTDAELVDYNVRALLKARIIAKLPDKPKKSKKADKATTEVDA